VNEICLSRIRRYFCKSGRIPINISYGCQECTSELAAYSPLAGTLPRLRSRPKRRSRSRIVDVSSCRIKTTDLAKSAQPTARYSARTSL
jgi:hypothetical protein